MERANDNSAKLLLLAWLLNTVMQEIAGFVDAGGLENPRARSLFRIQIYMFFFLLILMLGHHIDLSTARSALSGLLGFLKRPKQP